MTIDDIPVSGSAKCPCGSGKKHKKCCGFSQPSCYSIEEQIERKYSQLRTAEVHLQEWLLHRGPTLFADDDIFDFAWDVFWGPLELSVDYDLMEQLFISWMLFDFRSFAGPTPLSPRSLADVICDNELSLPEKLRPDERAFLAAGRSTTQSWYCIEKVREGIEIEVRDLFDNSYQIVREHHASLGARPGDCLLGRVIRVFGVNAFFGVFPIPIGPHSTNVLLKARDSLVESDFGLRGDKVGLPPLVAKDIAIRTFFIELTNEIAESHAKGPQIVNYDGDPLVFYKLSWTVRCPLEEGAGLLRSICKKSDDADDCLEVKRSRAGTVSTYIGDYSRPGLKSKAAGMDRVNVASFTLKDGVLRAEVNSQKRGEEVKLLISETFGARVEFKSMYRAKVATKTNSAKQPSQEELMGIPEVQEKLREMAKSHWQRWFDDPIPMLDDMTPREAAKSSRGRELLEALFREYARHPDDGKNPFYPDIPHLRGALGLDLNN